MYVTPPRFLHSMSHSPEFFDVCHTAQCKGYIHSLVGTCYGTPIGTPVGTNIDTLYISPKKYTKDEIYCDVSVVFM